MPRDARASKTPLRANATILVMLLGVVGCTTLAHPFRTADPGARLEAGRERGAAVAESTGRIDALELQSRVMGMADDYGSEIAEIVYAYLKPAATTSRERVLAQSYVRNSFGAAAEIAAGPNPEASLLDLLVLISLQRAAFERVWIPKIWGEERGRVPLERLRKLEARLWAQSDILLSAEQQATLRRLIAAWLKDNPDRLVVELVRFDEFADARHLSSLEDRQAASGLLKEVGEAVGAIDDALLFGERMLWYSGRLVYILGQQTELTTARVLADPAIEETLSAVTGFNDGFRTTLQAALSDLVQEIKVERETIINHFFARWQAEREQLLASLDRESERLRGLMPELRETIAASTELMRVTGESAATIDRIAGRFASPTRVDSAPGTGIPEIRALVAEASQATDRLTALLERAEFLLQSPAWAQRTQEMDRLSSGLIDGIFWRAALLIALIFAGLVALRYVPMRRQPTRESE